MQDSSLANWTNAFLIHTLLFAVGIALAVAAPFIGYRLFRRIQRRRRTWIFLAIAIELSGWMLALAGLNPATGNILWRWPYVFITAPLAILMATGYGLGYFLGLEARARTLASSGQAKKE